MLQKLRLDDGRSRIRPINFPGLIKLPDGASLPDSSSNQFLWFLKMDFQKQTAFPDQKIERGTRTT